MHCSLSKVCPYRHNYINYCTLSISTLRLLNFSHLYIIRTQNYLNIYKNQNVKYLPVVVLPFPNPGNSTSTKTSEFISMATIFLWFFSRYFVSYLGRKYINPFFSQCFFHKALFITIQAALSASLKQQEETHVCLIILISHMQQNLYWLLMNLSFIYPFSELFSQRTSNCLKVFHYIFFEWITGNLIQ